LSAQYFISLNYWQGVQRKDQFSSVASHPTLAVIADRIDAIEQIRGNTSTQATPEPAISRTVHNFRVCKPSYLIGAAHSQYLRAVSRVQILKSYIFC